MLTYTEIIRCFINIFNIHGETFKIIYRDISLAELTP